MPYDALGNYIPGDEEPSGALPRQELNTAVKHLKRTATEYNPLMMLKSLQDLPRAAYNMSIAPALSTWAGALKGAQAEGAARIYEGLGMPEDAVRVRSAIEPITPTGFQAPLQTPMGEAFQESVGKAAETAKLPHMWPMAVSHLETRPFLTPNDVRVMGAEATRIGRQVRDIPSDFANAQSGITRIDPITGQPTMGVKLQGLSEDVGRIIEQRQAMGKTTIPGLPEILMPETRTYAVRPAGTSLTVPQGMPAGMEARYLPTGSAIFRTLEDTLGPTGAKMTVDDAAGQLNYMQDHTPGIDQRAFGEFEKRKAMERYPDAPTPEDAFEALMTSTPADERKQLTLKHYDEFRQTPEGIAAGYGQLPSSTELMQRDEEARRWLQGPFVNHFKKHFGAENDPLVRLASTGVTYKPAHEIEPLDPNLELGTVRNRREAEGLPVEGTVAPALHAAQAKLSEAEAKVTELNTRREQYRDIAQQQGLRDPAQLPEYANLSRPLDKAIAERNKLQEEVSNLELGKLYEDRSDMAVAPRTPEAILKNMEYRLKQFYPGVTRAQPGEKLYMTLGSGALRDLGYDAFVTEFYNSVLEGKIPLDKLKNLTVEKAVKELAEPRIVEEKAKAKAQLTYKTDAETVMKATTDKYVKPENRFGNVAALELTQYMGLDIPTMTKILSEDTTVLDHCIAQGGGAGRNKPNPWFPKKEKKYDAIYDIVTGQKNPNAGRDTSSYVNSILAGDSITSFRDANIGLPVATFQLHRSHIGQDGQQKYSIGYASGHQNGAVSPEYVDGIKDYLNANESMIAGTGSYLSTHLGIYDTQDLSSIRRDLSLKRNDMDLVDWQSMPRFVTGNEIKATIQATKDLQGSTQAPVVARREPGGPLQPTDELPQALRDDIMSARDNAITSVADAGDAASNAGEAARRLEMALNHFLDVALVETATVSDIEQMISSLRASANSYRNHQGNVGEFVANGMEEFITDLEGIRGAANRGHYTPAAATPAAATPALPTFDVVDFDNFVGDIRQNVDAQVAHDIVRISNTVADALGTNVRGALANQPTEFAQRLADHAEMEENAMLEEALRDLADRIAPPIREPLPDIFFEPDETHPANQQQQLTPQQIEDIAFELFNDTRRGEDPNAPRNLEELRTTLQALETGNFDDMRIRALPVDQRDRAQRDIAHQIRAIMDDVGVTLPAEPQQQQVADFRPIAEPATEMTYDQLRDTLTPAEQNIVSAAHDDLVRANPNSDELRTIAQLVYDHQMSVWENFPNTARAMLYMDLLSTANRMDAAPQRRGPFRPGGASAVRGLPLGNLNLQPAITADLLRGPDIQPVRNFIQQVQNLPGVTQEGLRTGLMAFEQMDPSFKISKENFVKELLPSSYDIVDLKGAAQDNQHVIDQAEEDFNDDPSPIGKVIGLEGRELEAWSSAVLQHVNDFDSFPKPVKKALAKQGIENAKDYETQYDDAYREAIENFVQDYNEYNFRSDDESGYTYANVQRLVEPDMGNQYGEFGVAHPDQQGTYHHFDLAPEGVIGHFRGTYNPADPIVIDVADFPPSSKRRKLENQTFETKPNSYVIEEIQSDAQKIAAQTGHLHQVHGVLFKAAIQKALELGATTVYLPTASVIASSRDPFDNNGQYIQHAQHVKKFAPIYDQAIVKEGLKPLLKIPGVTSTMVNGYHEISFTPEAIERILYGQGQAVPGYKDGGQVSYPSAVNARHEAITRAQEMYPNTQGQDDQADVARHMLASGYISQAFGPTVAKSLGYLHEFKEAPFRTAGSWLGLSKPRYDYEMDVHNNALGADLAQKAKDRFEFEKMVQQSIQQGTTSTQPGRARLMTPDQAKVGREALKYANGGTVSNKDKIAVLLRSK